MRKFYVIDTVTIIVHLKTRFKEFLKVVRWKIKVEYCRKSRFQKNIDLVCGNVIKEPTIDVFYKRTLNPIRLKPYDPIIEAT